MTCCLKRKHTVDGRNPAPPGIYKHVKLNKNGINYQPQLVSRISSINSMNCQQLDWSQNGFGFFRFGWKRITVELAGLPQPTLRKVNSPNNPWMIHFPTFTINISQVWVNTGKYAIHGWCTVRIFPRCRWALSHTQCCWLPLLKRRMPRPQAFRKRRQAATSGLDFFNKRNIIPLDSWMDDESLFLRGLWN